MLSGGTLVWVKFLALKWRVIALYATFTFLRLKNLPFLCNLPLGMGRDSMPQPLQIETLGPIRTVYEVITQVTAILFKAPHLQMSQPADTLNLINQGLDRGGRTVAFGKGKRQNRPMHPNLGRDARSGQAYRTAGRDTPVAHKGKHPLLLAKSTTLRANLPV